MSISNDEHNPATSSPIAKAESKRVSLGRPRYHVVAPSGWMNDPCAPGYIPSTGEFTLMYQWNPYSHLWDNISWGQMKSRDLVSWEQVGNEPVFIPDQPYDHKGIFTGCFHPGPIQANNADQADKSENHEQVCIFYTSVPELPIHWTKPHVRGQEGVACAISNDGGQTWHKHSSNPVIEKEPDHLQVGGFRDPSLIPWPTLDSLLSRPPGSGLYALISGSVNPHLSPSPPSSSSPPLSDQGPRLFLYDVNPDNLFEWSFLSTLGKTYPRNVVPHAWTGDFGANWECATVFPLTDARTGLSRDVCILGVEGGELREHVEDYRKRHVGKKGRDARYAHWSFVNLTLDASYDNDNEHEQRNGAGGVGTESAHNDGPSKRIEHVDMKHTTSGLVDWAELYALATFPHPDGRRIAWGWLVELDLSDKLMQEKGWTSCLGLPRQLDLKVYDGVLGTVASDVRDIGSFVVVQSSSSEKKVVGRDEAASGSELESASDTELGLGEGMRVITFGVEPLAELKGLRKRQIMSGYDDSRQEEFSRMPECFELQLIAAISSKATDRHDISILLRADPVHPDISTRITFSPTTERIIIERESSSPLVRPFVDAESETPTPPRPRADSLDTSSDSTPEKQDPARVQGQGPESAKDICLQNEIAPFTLLRFDDSIELLDLRVFVDRDVIEVFANGRVALSTRVYAPREANGLRLEVGQGWEVDSWQGWEMGSIGIPE